MVNNGSLTLCDSVIQVELRHLTVIHRNSRPVRHLYIKLRFKVKIHTFGSFICLSNVIYPFILNHNNGYTVYLNILLQSSKFHNL
jgi:hypothetical protein